MGIPKYRPQSTIVGTPKGYSPDFGKPWRRDCYRDSLLLSLLSTGRAILGDDMPFKPIEGQHRYITPSYFTYKPET